MNCQNETCNGQIEQGRLDWAQEKGYTVKYCKVCSDAKKAAAGNQGGYKKGGQKSPGEQLWIAWQSSLRTAVDLDATKNSADCVAAAKHFMDEGLAYVASKTPKEQ